MGTVSTHKEGTVYKLYLYIAKQGLMHRSYVSYQSELNWA